MERLEHRPGEIVIGITESAGGRKCVGMTYNNQEWFLLTTKSSPIAHGIREELKEGFNIEAIIGLGVDWRSSLENSQIVLLDDPEKPPYSGIYVKPENFDTLINQLSGL